jgi:hypothetical protein
VKKIMILSLLGLSILSCAHRKKQYDYPMPESTAASAQIRSKSLGAVFKVYLDDPQFAITDLLDNCVKGSCDDSSERSLASKLKALNFALRDKDKPQIASLSDHLVEDFHKLMNSYSDQREYIVPVVYQAWFLAGAIYPYSKQVSQGLFGEVQTMRRILDARSPKPFGYYYLVALETEYQNGRDIDKVQAYKKCIDAEPSNKRCQESYLRLSAEAPKAIKASESNLARDCRPEIDKSGFTLHVASTEKNRKYGGPKRFAGEKYYYDRDELLGVSDIEALWWNKKPTAMTIKVTDFGVLRLKKAMKSLQGKVLVMMKKDLIYAASGVGPMFKSHPQELRFTKLDTKGLAEFLHDCK